MGMMPFIKTSLATDWCENKTFSIRILEVVLFFIPKANPGYDGKMHLLHEWFIEFDENGSPWREVGIDINGAPLFSGPSDKDCGFWLDSNMKQDDFIGLSIGKKEFEKIWEKSGVGENT